MVCPAPQGSRKGNRVTAERWALLLREHDHLVSIAEDWQGESCDLLIALHAKKSYRAIKKYRTDRPDAPLVVALTGTDLYRDLPVSRQAQQSLQWADRLIGLHECVTRSLPQPLHAKVRVILQSAQPTAPRLQRSEETFDICVLGHLRHEKDPLRTALAVRRLPRLRQLRVIHAGEALSPRFEKWARSAMRKDARYRWLAELSRAEVGRLLAASHVMVISSRMEGGANVVSEAIVNGVPILASKIPGNEGLLGEAYPGYFPVADTDALARLLDKTCNDKGLYRELTDRVLALQPRFQPQHEREHLQRLVREFSP